MKMHPNFILSERAPPYILPEYFHRPLAVTKATIAIPHWRELLSGGISPANLYYLRCWLGTHNSAPQLVSDINKERFRNADIAWLISGMHKDGKHEHDPAGLHPDMGALFKPTSGDPAARAELKALFAEIQGLMMDAAAALDRLSGSTTLIIRSSGTTPPSTPVEPEFLKANVYLSPMFVAHNPDLHRVLVDIVQQYVETVGTRSVHLWVKRSRKTLNYSFQVTKTDNNSKPPNPTMLGIPAPINKSSSCYLFYGQPHRILKPISASDMELPTTASVLNELPSSSQDSYSFDPFDDSWHEVINLTEKTAILQDKIATLEERNSILKASNQELLDELARTDTVIKGLEARLKASTPKIAATTSPLPATTPSRLGDPATPSQRPTTVFRGPATPHSVWSSTAVGSTFNPNVTFSPQMTSSRACGANRPLSTPTRSHPFGSPTAARNISKSSGVSAAFSPASISAADLVDEKSIGDTMLSRLIQTNGLAHLNQVINNVFAFWPQDKWLSSLIDLGVGEEVAKMMVSVKVLDVE